MIHHCQLRSLRLPALGLLLLAAPVYAAEPLVRNGDFEATPSADGWRLTPLGADVVTVDGTHVLNLVRTTPGTTAASQVLTLDPNWGALRFRYRVNVLSLKPGSEAWHDARIALTFRDAAGVVTHLAAGDWRSTTAGWDRGDVQVPIPAKAVSVEIAPSLFNAVGVWQLDDLVVSVAGTRGAGSDAAIPAGQSVTWGQEPIETCGPTRGTICLNGLWRFQPALGIATQQPQDTGWGWLRVPGSWRPSSLPQVVSATGPQWERFTGDCPAGWYERELAVPADWQGRAIELQLPRVSTDAVVWLDAREVGSVSWPGGVVDLTATVTPGRTHRLRIKVVAVADQKNVTRFMGMGDGQILTEQAILTTRGIVGDVLLTSRPTGAHLASCAIRTTVVPPTVVDPAHGDTLAVSVAYLALPAATPLALTAVVRDATGRDIRRFTASVAASAGDGSIDASWTWPDPQLWDVDQPQMYALDLTVQGSGIADTLHETFGFREFRIDGRRFLLNGTEIRLRPSPVHAENPIGGVRELIGDALNGLRWAGFNCYEMWPWNRAERGTWEFDELWCQEADRRGLLLIAPALDQSQLVSDWQRPGVSAAWAQAMRPALTKLRNHPSVVMWVTGANRFGHGQDQNPEAIGNHERGWIPHPGWRKAAESGLDALRLIKEVDPTRPVFMHAGGPVGDVYTANNYLCLIPLQEREEWPSRWAASGDMPLLMVEFGTPLYTTFHRGRAGYNQATSSEPLYSEYCAIYQGPEAYALESPAYRATLAATFDHDQLWRSWHRVEKAALHEGFNRLQALFQTNTWRTWRTWGVTGGILPWDNGAGWLREQVTRGVDGNPTGPARLDSLAPFIPGTRGAWRPQATRGLTQYLRPAGMPLTVAGQALVEANRPTLAWIAGAPDFTDKTHHFRAGAEVAKQIALVNDARHASRWSLSWSAELDGRTLANGTAAGELAPATNGFAPVTFTIPRELTAERVAGSIRLTCTIGDQRSEDRFAFHAFRSGRGTLPAVDVLDPVGETSALLRDLGCDTTTWDGSRHDRLLVVGRKAFSSGTADPTRLAAFFAAGGRALLLAQDPDCLRQHFGLRVARQLTRRAYPVLADHPALAGLDAEAFRDWAGSSHLVAEHVTDQTDNRTPTYGWRWGSRHTLCSAAIETPHRAGWRPLLSCEFDGAYTPLAEATVGAGVMTVCMLDLEDHVAADPAAERVARAVLTSAATTPITNHQPVTYLGGPDGAALLTAAGIRLVAATSLPTSGLVAIGADAVIADAELDRFLTQGGTALILPRRTTTGPLGVRLQEIALHDGSLSVPTWESCRGIAPGELRRRTAGPAWVISGGADAIGADGELAEIHRGRGTAVFCQLDTVLLDADHLSYNRLTRWRWTRALNQLASNLGAACAGDDRLFTPLAPPDRLSLAGTWNGTLTLPLPAIGPSQPKPRDPGISSRARVLVARNADESGLQECRTGAPWESYGGAWAEADGEAVFRRTVDIPAHWAGHDLRLSLGAVDDFDTTFFDGEQVGTTDISVPSFWSVKRHYTIPARLVTPGRHVIAVRVFDHFGGGGLVGDADDLVLAPQMPLTPPATSLYHPDWRDDFPLGDDPARYCRW